MARDRKRHVVRPTGPEPACAPVVEAPPGLRPRAQCAAPVASGAPDEPTFAQRISAQIAGAIAVLVVGCIVGVILIPTCSHLDRESANRQYLDTPAAPALSTALEPSPWSGRVPAADDWLNAHLRDPDSVKDKRVTAKLARGNDGLYRVTYEFRAKNGFGGYNLCTQQFVLNAAGVVVDVQDLRLPSE